MRRRTLVTATAAVALAVRITYVLAAKHDEPVAGDQIYYSAQAQVIARGKFFVHPHFGGEAADHPPLTSLLLATVEWIAPGSLLAQRLTMALAGTIVVIALALLVDRLAGRRAGAIAGVVAALDPNLWMNDGLVMSETFTALAVVALLGATYRYLHRPTWSAAAWAGLAAGLATLVRAELALAALGVAVVIVTVAKAPAKRSLAASGLAGLVAVAIVTPWVAFNLARFEHPTFFTTSDGLLLYGANCADTYYGEGLGFWSLRCALENDPPAADQSERSAHWRRAGLRYLSEHQTRLPIVIAAREGRVWGLYRVSAVPELSTGEGRERWASWMGIVAYWLLWPFTIVGAVIARRRAIALGPLVVMFVHVAIVAGAVYGLARFRLPADIAMIVLSAIAIDALLSARRPMSASG